MITYNRGHCNNRHYLGHVKNVYDDDDDDDDPECLYRRVRHVACVAGLGLGMIYLPSIVVISQYFSARRALATGIAMCGSGVGTFIFAPLTNALLAQFAWKGTVLIEAAILLNCIPCGLVFRPLLKSSRKTKKDSSPGDELEQDERMSQNTTRETVTPMSIRYVSHVNYAFLTSQFSHFLYVQTFCTFI